MEQKLDTLSSALQNMQDMILKKGILAEGQQLHKDKAREKGKQINSDAESETMIYYNAVPKADSQQLNDGVQVNEVNVDREILFRIREKRDSSSSEERIDTSDELMDLKNENTTKNVDPHIKFIAECQERERISGGEALWIGNNPGPSMTESEHVIREAEVSKARLYGTPGNGNSNNLQFWQTNK